MPADKPRVERRQSEREAEEATLALVRAMGEGDIFQGLGKLGMLRVLDNVGCAWLKVLYAGLAETTSQKAVCLECVAKVCVPELEDVKKREH